MEQRSILLISSEKKVLSRCAYELFFFFSIFLFLVFGFLLGIMYLYSCTLPWAWGASLLHTSGTYGLAPRSRSWYHAV